VLRSTPDIAVVLLDVIMETRMRACVARQIREELHNSAVRIILRTGQPGQALEHRIIIDYDINDFWCKTDLTTRKLFTTVIASLRTYATLREAEQQVADLAEPWPRRLPRRPPARLIHRAAARTSGYKQEHWMAYSLRRRPFWPVLPAAARADRPYFPKWRIVKRFFRYPHGLWISLWISAY
jgi:hypothetical protein